MPFRPDLMRQIAALSWPVLVAQLAYMGVAAADTILTGRYGTNDLAAIAIGNSVYVTVAVTLSNVLQAISPIVAHLHGARREDARVAGALRQGFWLALLLGALGWMLLRHPQPLIAWSSPEPEVEAIAVEYLRTVAWGLPAQTLFRTFYAFTAGLGRPRPVMAITVAGALIDVPLAWLLIYGKLGGAPLGTVGCAVASAAVAWFALAAGLALLVCDRHYARYAVFRRWEAPSRHQLAELLRLGLPIGFSTLVEVSAFTMIALFVAPFGAAAVAGHRIVANLVAILYMLPLALGNGASVLIAQAAGARDWQRARALAANAMLMGLGLALALAAAVWLGRHGLVALYSADMAVREIALALMIYVAIGHVVDATQAVASLSLRGYKITLLPMLIHALVFWGVGLAGGWWLAFGEHQAGVAGFWMAAVASLALATVLVGSVLWLAAARREPA